MTTVHHITRKSARRPYLRRGLRTTAMRFLQHRELTTAALAERLGQRYPGEQIDVDAVLQSLVKSHYVMRDGLFHGLTARGHAAMAEISNEANPESAPLTFGPPPRVIGDLDGPVAAVVNNELDQRAALVPHFDHADLLTRSPPRNAASQADLAPQPVRPGAVVASYLPSRIGNRLRWRDGRVTDLDGKPI
jgi:hypothetical protein